MPLFHRDTYRSSILTIKSKSPRGALFILVSFSQITFPKHRFSMPILDKIKSLNEARKEKKWYLNNLEPEIRETVKQAKLDVSDREVRAKLNESQTHLRETKKRKELLQLLGLHPPDPDSLEASADECRDGKHKLLPCGHLTPRLGPHGCCDDTCFNGENFIFRYELPRSRRNKGRKREEVYRDRQARNYHSFSIDSEHEQLPEEFEVNKMLCQTCVFRKFQESFFFTMQEVKYDAELVESRMGKPWELSVPGLHRLVDFKFQNPDGTCVGGTVPIQLWDLWLDPDHGGWDYITAIGTAINNPEYLDIEIPPEYEVMDVQLLDLKKRDRMCKRNRRPPEIMPYSVEDDIRKYYFIHPADLRQSRGRRTKQVRFDDFEPLEMINRLAEHDDLNLLHHRPTAAPRFRLASPPPSVSSESLVSPAGHVQPMNCIAGIKILREWRLPANMDILRLPPPKSARLPSEAEVPEEQYTDCEPEMLSQRKSEHRYRLLPQYYAIPPRKPVPTVNARPGPYLIPQEQPGNPSIPNPLSFRERTRRQHPMAFRSPRPAMKSFDTTLQNISEENISAGEIHRVIPWGKLRVTNPDPGSPSSPDSTSPTTPNKGDAEQQPNRTPKIGYKIVPAIVKELPTFQATNSNAGRPILHRPKVPKELPMEDIEQVSALSSSQTPPVYRPYRPAYQLLNGKASGKSPISPNFPLSSPDRASNEQVGASSGVGLRTSQEGMTQVKPARGLHSVQKVGSQKAKVLEPARGPACEDDEEEQDVWLATAAVEMPAKQKRDDVEDLWLTAERKFSHE